MLVVRNTISCGSARTESEQIYLSSLLAVEREATTKNRVCCDRVAQKHSTGFSDRQDLQRCNAEQTGDYLLLLFSHSIDTSLVL